MLADRVFADVWEAMIHDDGVVPVTAREWAAELSERAVDMTSGLGNMLPRVAPVTSMRADRGAAPVLSAMAGFQLHPAIREYDRLAILICTTQYRSLIRLSPPPPHSPKGSQVPTLDFLSATGTTFEFEGF